MGKASNTRYNILEKAFKNIYENGYRSTSIDDIIATTEVTKGAFYYHFKSKDEMGIAIINEIIKPEMEKSLISPLLNAKKPTEDIHHTIEFLLFDSEFLEYKYGCPVGNLTQEMTPWNTRFTKLLKSTVEEWRSAIESSIKKGIDEGNILDNVNPKQVAYFVLTSYWGIRNFGKVCNSNDCYNAYLKELKKYLNSLSKPLPQ